MYLPVGLDDATVPMGSNTGATSGEWKYCSGVTAAAGI